MRTSQRPDEEQTEDSTPEVVLEAGCECVDDEDVQVLSTVFPARVGILYYLLRIVDSHMSAHHVRCVDVFVIGNCRGTGESHRYRDASEKCCHANTLG